MSKKSHKKKTLLPKLRFPEFKGDGEWSCLNGKSLFAQISDKNHNGDLPVLAITQEHGAIPRELIDYNVSVTQSSINSYKIVRVGDFIISLRSFQGGIEYSNYEGICSPAYVILREKRGTVAAFFKYLFKSKAFIRELTKNLEGLRDGKMISYKQFSEVLIHLPSKPEQQKIADCLSSLDDLLAAHSAKLNALQDHKKGLLQQLFPGTPTSSSAIKKNAGEDAGAPSQTTPALRFPEFENEGEWVLSKLGPMATKVGSGITPRGGASNYRESGRPFIRSQNVSWGSLLLDDVVYIDEKMHQSFAGTEIKITDVFLNITGASIGRCTVANSEIKGGNVNQHVCLIRTKAKKLVPLFLSQFIISQFGQSQIDSFQAGGNRQGLNFEQVRSFFIPIPPNRAEQQKIADCLSALADVIAAQTKQIAALKEHKKGLMQQLFSTGDSV